MTQSNRPNLPQLVHSARATVSQRLDNLLQQAGLSLSQWQVLSLFEKSREIDFHALQQTAGKLAQGLSPALDALEKAGLIEYRGDQGDETIYLTARGHFILQRFNPKIAFLYGQIERRRQHPALKSAYQSLANLITPRDK